MYDCELSGLPTSVCDQAILGQAVDANNSYWCEAFSFWTPLLVCLLPVSAYVCSSEETLAYHLITTGLTQYPSSACESPITPAAGLTLVLAVHV